MITKILPPPPKTNNNKGSLLKYISLGIGSYSHYKNRDLQLFFYVAGLATFVIVSVVPIYLEQFLILQIKVKG